MLVPEWEALSGRRSRLEAGARCWLSLMRGWSYPTALTCNCSILGRMTEVATFQARREKESVRWAHQLCPSEGFEDYLP